MAKRLLDNHPLMIKYRLLEEFLETNSIQIIRGHEGLKIKDPVTDLEVIITDLEDSGCHIQEIPYGMETKLIIQ